ncbi:hypothetical protein E2C01_074533 [Portunus trituberculatus]|uniref:Uncharacterized protein n=1 Tax=Portunus trituberculatus TaxID=210409 RepID=A0A5B7ICD3_PORTR|nr:hypothetical protein [Portunus trituberculatus]
MTRGDGRKDDDMEGRGLKATTIRGEEERTTMTTGKGKKKKVSSL